jgi:hypothetical protein
MIQYGVAALEKDPAILCELRLVLNHLGGSEFINMVLPEYIIPKAEKACHCSDDALARQPVA